jgi:hypothetical protein
MTVLWNVAMVATGDGCLPNALSNAEGVIAGSARSVES